MALAATHTSRWYLNAAFTTFLVFWTPLYQQTGSGQIAHRFFERTLETLVGVGIAYFSGLIVPRVLEGYAQRRAAQRSAMRQKSGLGNGFHRGGRAPGALVCMR